MGATGTGGEAILCVDDEAVILLALRQELRRRFGDRYSILTALGADRADAVIAETEAAGGSVALVICDWFMPGRRGDQFLLALRERRPGIKAILMTGQSDGAAIREALGEAAICACVQKPWRTEALAKAIEDCLLVE
jgi:DNA-binding NtrC family response regulator